MTTFSRSNPGRGKNRRWTDPISVGRATAWLMEFAIRAFSRETPGRTRNRMSRIATAAAATRRLEEKGFTALLATFAASASHQKSATQHVPQNPRDPLARFLDTRRPVFQTTSKLTSGSQ